MSSRLVIAPAVVLMFSGLLLAQVSSDQTFVDESIRFDGSASFDPDEGPSALAMEWDLGDGTLPTIPEASLQLLQSGLRHRPDVLVEPRHFLRQRWP